MFKFLKPAVFVALLATSTMVSAKQAEPRDVQGAGVSSLIHQLPYKPISAVLQADGTVTTVTNLVATLLANTSSDVNYDALLSEAHEIVNTLAGSAVLNVGSPHSVVSTRVFSPRVVITEADGTVIVDTGAWTASGPSWIPTSTRTNWLAKAINENHNSRVAIMETQLWTSGLGVETKYSSSVGTTQDYVAIRLGDYLNNYGTIRLSQNVLLD